MYSNIFEYFTSPLPFLSTATQAVSGSHPSPNRSFLYSAVNDGYKTSINQCMTSLLV